jgi:hypothetical protein
MQELKILSRVYAVPVPTIARAVISVPTFGVSFGSTRWHLMQAQVTRRALEDSGTRSMMIGYDYACYSVSSSRCFHRMRFMHVGFQEWACILRLQVLVEYHLNELHSGLAGKELPEELRRF